MRTLRPLPEIKRLAYGSIGLLLGIAIDRISGLHVVVRQISTGGAVSNDPLWLAVFVTGVAVSLGAMMWFWLLRPTLARERPTESPNDRQPTEELPP